MDRYDVIVVGAGTAGIPCAVEAARAGARVLLLEKAGDVGGTLHVSGGHLSAAGTRRQAERGIADSADAHFADVVRISRDTARRDLVRLAVDGAAATLAWLEDAGFVHADSSPRIVHGHEEYGAPRTYYGPDDGRSILAPLRRLLAEEVAAGRVTLALSSPVTELLTEDGAVVGVRTGGDADLRAGAVVLATGGFGADPALFRRFTAAPLVTAAWPTSTGDGLRLAEAAGAGVAGRDAYLPTFGGLPPPDGGSRVEWSERPLLTSERPPWEVYVDRRGRRWIAEDEPSIDRKERALTGVEEMTFWTVFDSRALRESRPMVVGWSPADLDARANVRPGVSRADTLPDLASRAGIDPPGLVAAVRRYNRAVATGHDEEFGRRHLPAPIAEPPFYALRNSALTLVTFAGVDVDRDLRVRRADGAPIPGLYAVGEVIGAAATTGNAFCGGMLVTPAITFGRLVGRRLAERTSRLRTAPALPTTPR
jgi:fumarate reductase flavoprotein subunit